MHNRNQTVKFGSFFLVYCAVQFFPVRLNRYFRFYSHPYGRYHHYCHHPNVATPYISPSLPPPPQLLVAGCCAGRSHENDRQMTTMRGRLCGNDQ
ncbi:hypothetical protein HanXRQr2_Chr12g0527401 [Helianthus annuus]|uniref:Uncharacterized protein n=1 Tax=Helianthus annuus TaxID=4232 RepID=A0A9K3ENT5_HELAN|nr:hypothetical protein HanXRQr2_Chr12g0527401 [Helianthus annuus]KAJ0861568.1 hypothetical protein HanPSC8_Chr12g0508181 [Helianthus annuus]